MLTPSDNSNLINFTNFDNIGLQTLKDSTAFKKIQFFSKTNPTNLFIVKSDFQNSFCKLNNLFLNDLDLNYSYTYGMDRQHTYTSSLSVLPMSSTLMDEKGVDKFFEYNLKKSFSQKNQNPLPINRLDYSGTTNSSIPSQAESLSLTYSKVLPFNLYNSSSVSNFPFFLKIPNIFYLLGAENDSKQYSNNFKLLLNPKTKKKTNLNMDYLLTGNSGIVSEEVKTTNLTNTFVNSTFNTENTLKFKDYKSSNAQFLGSERTVRLLNNLNSNLYKWNVSATPNTTSYIGDKLMGFGSSQNYLYTASLSNWSDLDKHIKFSNNTI